MHRERAAIDLARVRGISPKRRWGQGAVERSIYLGAPNKTKPAGHGLMLFFVKMFATRRTKRKMVKPAAVP
jgi:hypothetical protein